MKKLIILAILILLTMPAMAEMTERGNYTTPIPSLTNFLNTNQYIHHNHAYEMFELENPMGLGVDVTVYEFGRESMTAGLAGWGIESVSVENRWDLNNETYGVFGVLNINIHQAIRNLLP